MEAVVTVSPQLLQANLESLDLRFRDQSTNDGMKFLRTAHDARAAIVLDSHLLRAPSGDAFDIRGDVDMAMRYYCILELASLVGAIPDPLPAALADETRATLSRAAVRRYYERYYPLLLPQFLLRRLNGQPLRVDFEGDGMSLLSRFIDVSSLREGDNAEMFLDFLDDITINDYGLGDVIRILQNGREFVHSMTTKKLNEGDQGVRGFVDFLGFSRELNTFLRQMKSADLLRSAFFHFHGYWFQQIGGQVLGAITAGVETLRTYVTDGADDDVIAKEIADTHKAMDTAIRDLQVLTSSAYRYPLELQLYDFTPR